jgi:hypothetical protein
MKHLCGWRQSWCRTPDDPLVVLLQYERAARSNAVCWGGVLAGPVHLYSASSFASGSKGSSNAFRLELCRHTHAGWSRGYSVIDG